MEKIDHNMSKEKKEKLKEYQKKKYCEANKDRKS